MAHIKVPEIEMLDVNELADNWWNPNSQTAEKFNALAESIKKRGFLENIQVTAITEELIDLFSDDLEGQEKLREMIAHGKKYLVLHGSHRFEAVRIAGSDAMPEIPAIVVDPSDSDDGVEDLIAESVFMNIIKGEIDADKFMKLWARFQNKPGFTEQAAQAMLGVTSSHEMDRLIKETKKGLPPEIAEGLEAAKEEIKTIDDLSRVLNTLFSRYGEDLTHAFMTFSYGGKLHTMVRLTKESNRMLARLKQYCREHDADINDVLIFAIRHVLGATEAQWPEPIERDLSIAE